MKISVEEHPLFSRNMKSRLSSLNDLNYESFDSIVNYITDNLSVVYFGKEYKEIKKSFVVLNARPESNGLGTLNSKINEIQGLKDRVASIMLDVYNNLGIWERILFYIEKFHKYNMNKLFSSDEIKELKNQDLRIAGAEEKIPKIINMKDFCIQQISEIKNFLKQCDIAFNNLKSVNDNVSRQITVIQQQMDIGEIRKKYN